MKTLTADTALLTVMKQFSEPTEVLDQNGQILATVYPSLANEEMMRKQIDELFDFGELERLKDVDRTNDRPFADVIARLKAKEGRP